MKAVFTLLFVIFFGLTAFAQNTITNDTVESTKMDIILDSGINISSDYNEVKTTPEKSVARLYKFKNSQVKKSAGFYN